MQDVHGEGEVTKKTSGGVRTRPAPAARFAPRSLAKSPSAHPPVRAVPQSITVQFESGKVDTYELESLRHLWPVIEAPPCPIASE